MKILPTLAVCPSKANSFFPAVASQICTKPLCVPTATRLPYKSSSWPTVRPRIPESNFQKSKSKKGQLTLSDQPTDVTESPSTDRSHNRVTCRQTKEKKTHNLDQVFSGYLQNIKR